MLIQKRTNFLGLLIRASGLGFDVSTGFSDFSWHWSLQWCWCIHFPCLGISLVQWWRKRFWHWRIWLMGDSRLEPLLRKECSNKIHQCLDRCGISMLCWFQLQCERGFERHVMEHRAGIDIPRAFEFEVHTPFTYTKINIILCIGGTTSNAIA